MTVGDVVSRTSELERRLREIEIRTLAAERQAAELRQAALLESQVFALVDAGPPPAYPLAIQWYACSSHTDATKQYSVGSGVLIERSPTLVPWSVVEQQTTNTSGVASFSAVSGAYYYRPNSSIFYPMEALITAPSDGSTVNAFTGVKYPYTWRTPGYGWCDASNYPFWETWNFTTYFMNVGTTSDPNTDVATGDLMRSGSLVMHTAFLLHKAGAADGGAYMGPLGEWNPATQSIIQTFTGTVTTYSPFQITYTAPLAPSTIVVQVN